MAFGDCEGENLAALGEGCGPDFLQRVEYTLRVDAVAEITGALVSLSG